MRLNTPVVFAILFALFLASLATRSATREKLDSPYFKGESAMVYAHALAAADGTPLDTLSLRANRPGGYTPARYRADGFESMWAAAFRAARFVSEVDGRDFARRFVVFLAALCVFTMYGLARRVWDCQAAGLLAAFLVAFLSPFVFATNGRTFTHTALIPFFDSLHAVVALATLAATSRRNTIVGALATALVSFVVAVSWELGMFVLMVWSAGIAVALGKNVNSRAVLIAHAIAAIAACVLSPYLAATRALGSFATLLVIVSVAIPFVPARIVPLRNPRAALLRAPVLLLASTSILWFFLTPLRAGATEQFPAWSYLAARIRYVFGKPEAAESLSNWTRHVWSLDHAPLQPYIAIALLVPIALLAAALVLNKELRARRIFPAAMATLAGAAIGVLIDRSLLPIAVIALVMVASGAAHTLGKSVRVRAPLVALAALIVFTSVVFRGQAADASYQLARSAGVANRDASSFVWVSFENTDRELVRFIATRTSVRESILAPDDLSALLLAFTGRSIATLPAAASKNAAERHVGLVRAMYGTEEDFFAACRAEKIDYVVYSIDVLLDTGRYSPRYLANAGTIEPASIAYRMHFDPESLQRFTLLYENDHYRLFQVSGTPQPIFATDHPPFYQNDLLAKANRDVDKFRQLAVEVMLTYAEGVKARTRGNAEGARRRLEWCLLQAPRYTAARIALADALMDLDRTEDARKVVLGLVQYAPDNTKGLYYAAYLSAQLGKKEEAKSYLELLLSIERDPQAIQKARDLENAVEHDLPIGRGAPRDPQG